MEGQRGLPNLSLWADAKVVAVLALIVPDVFGVMSVDPGGKTGCAVGVFRPQATVAATLRRARRKGAIKVAECSNMDPVQSAWELSHTWREFKYLCNVDYGIPLGWIWLVIEDFHTRTVLADLAPVKVTWGLRTIQRIPLGLEAGEVREWHDDVPEDGLIYQEASDAKKYATSARLRSWKLFDLGRGSEHKRDALRHLALRVSRVMGDDT